MEHNSSINGSQTKLEVTAFLSLTVSPYGLTSTPNSTQRMYQIGIAADQAPNENRAFYTVRFKSRLTLNANRYNPPITNLSAVNETGTQLDAA
jgi:hypothetical protein